MFGNARQDLTRFGFAKIDLEAQQLVGFGHPARFEDRAHAQLKLLEVGVFGHSGNRDFAKDLLHDGFLKAFTSLDKFFYRGEGSLKAWLSRIMVNTALEAIRKQTQHIELDIETAPEIADPEYEDDDKVVKNIPQETLLRFISELPDGYRTVFNLFTFENKSHKEIANLLHINEKSSSSQLHRARTILMNRVKQYWAQYENG